MARNRFSFRTGSAPKRRAAKAAQIRERAERASFRSEERLLAIRAKRTDRVSRYRRTFGRFVPLNVSRFGYFFAAMTSLFAGLGRGFRRNSFVTLPLGGRSLGLESLESRQMLSVNYVNDNWTVDAPDAGDGLQVGDAVTSSGAEGSIHGHYGVDAFGITDLGSLSGNKTIQDAITAAGAGGTSNLLSGIYDAPGGLGNDMGGPLTIGPGFTLAGVSGQTATIQSSTGPTITANTGAGTSHVDNLTVQYLSAGINIDVKGTLNITNSIVDGGLTGVNVGMAGASLTMSNTIIQNSSVFGLNVGATGATANVSHSEFNLGSGSGAGVLASDGTVTIDTSTFSATNTNARGVLATSNGAVTVTGSDFSGIAGPHAVTNSTVSSNLDASKNWWGATATMAGDTAVLARTEGTVDITPYLDSGVELPVGVGARGFDGDLSHLHVTAQGVQTSGNRIDEAIGYLADGAAVGGAREIDVHTGTYDETVLVDKAVKLTSVTPHGAQLVRTSGTQQSVVSIDANDVTIDGFSIQVNQNNSGGQPIAPVGISAFGTQMDNLVINDNVITSIGSNAVQWSTVPSGGLTVHAAGIVLNDAPSGNIPLVTLTGNNVNITSGSSFFQRAVWLSQLNADIKGNTLAGAANDLQFQFASGGPSTIGGPNPTDGNSFVGQHRAGAAGVVIAEPNANSPILVQNNMFAPTAGDPANIQTGLQINNDLNGTNGSPVTVTGNTFTGDVLGLQSSTSNGLTITANVFTPATNPLATPFIGGDFLHIAIDSPAQDPMNPAVVIEGNTFNAPFGSSGTAIGLAKSLAAPSGVVSIGVGAANTYDGDLVTGVRSTGGVATISDTINSLDTAVDILGGTVTVTGSAIAGNITGIHVGPGGAATISGNNFDGGANPDNSTDLRIDSGAGAVAIGAGNAFAGDTYFIDNQSTQSFNLTGVNAQTYEGLTPGTLADDFRIEDHMFHGPDNGTSGVVYWVQDNLYVTENGTGSNDEKIQWAVDTASASQTVNVEKGTFIEDVNVTKAGLRLIGSGPEGPNATTISGAIGGDGTTVKVSANNVEVAGLTITREGNNTTDWNNPGLNSAGIAVQGVAIVGMLIHDNRIIGNRTGIDINNSNGHTIRNNRIVDNRTGMILRNQTDNLLVTENDIAGNWTVGVLFLDASGGSNSPVQQAVGSTFTNNNISGNWYGEIVDRQVGGLVPAPGTNLKDFSGNWFGSTAPGISSADSAEPGYAAQIPTAYGGSASAPGGQPDVLGPAVANFDITPYLNSGVDTDVETTPGRGTYGFQGNFDNLTVTSQLAQTGATGRIQEGITLATDGGTVHVLGGTYGGDVDATTKAITLAAGAGIAQVTVNGDLALDGDDSLPIELNGTNAANQYDNFIVNGDVSLGGSTLTVTRGFNPFPGDSFTIINNDGAEAPGMFAGLGEGSVIVVSGVPMTLSYVGGDGNDVVLTVTEPTDIWVNDTWQQQADNSGGGAGIQVGDTVQSDGGAGDAAVMGKIFGYNAFNTIQEAVDAASVSPTSTIHVLTGTYDEAVLINKDGLTVQLYGTANSAVVTRTTGSGQALVTVAANNVTLVGLKYEVVQPFAVAGVYMNSTTATPYDNLTVTNSTFTIAGPATDHAADGYIGFDTSSTAISVRGQGTYPNNPTVTITNNQILPTLDMSGNATAMFDRAIFLREANGLIEDNIVYGDAHDLAAQFVGGGTVMTPAQLVVNQNQFLGKGGRDTRGAQVDFTEPDSHGAIVVTNNTFTPFAGTTPSNSTHVRSLMVKNNNSGASVLIDNNTFTAVSEVGLLLANAKSATVTNNTFDAAAGDSDFVYLQVSNKVPTGGAIAANQLNATIQGNEFNEGTVAGGRAIEFLNHNSVGASVGSIVIGGAGVGEANTFEDGLDAYIYLDASSGASTTSSRPFYSGPGAYGTTTMAPWSFDLDAQNNKFGVTSGEILPTAMTLSELFEVEDKIVHGPDNASLGVVTVVPNNLYVTTPSTGITDETIQNAIDVAGSGDTVNVQDGTYAEQLSIAKDLTLVGESQGGTIVQAPTNLTTDNAFTTAFDGRTRQSVIAVTAGNVAISTLTVDGNNAGSTIVGGNDFHGIGIHDANVDIDSVTVTNVRDNPLNGIQRGRAIFAGNDTGAHTVSVDGSTIQNYQKNGIDLRGAGLTGLIGTSVGNTITGAGATPLIAQNGIVVLGGAVATISNNTITGHKYTGMTADDAAGVLLYGSGAGTIVSANPTIDANDVGVWLDSTDYATQATITGNTITGSVVAGIAATGVGSNKAKVEGNTVVGSGVAGNKVGILVSGGAIVDAGSDSMQDGDPTGLGNSAGNNILTGYTGSSLTGNYAIKDLNLAAQSDVYARNNDFGPFVDESIIENYVYDDTDDPTRSMVIFTGAQNQINTPPTEVWVDDSWTGVALGDDADGMGPSGSAMGYDQFANIQDALNAVAANGIVHVFAGLYSQNLSIDKAVQVLGPNQGVAGNGSRSSEAEIHPTATTSPAAMIEVNASGVTIDGFTIDGDDAAYRAVRVNGVDDVSVLNNIITNAVRGVQYNGAAVGNSGGVVGRNLIQSLTSDPNGSYGVVAFDSSYVEVTDNTMTGLDIGVFEQYFYQPNAGDAANTISGNNITAVLLGYGTNERSETASVTALSGNTYTIAGSAGSVGVQLYNIYKTGGITLTNETITGAETGVYAFINGGSATISGGSITGNGSATSQGVQLTNYLGDFSYAATDNGDVTVDSVDISNVKTGVNVEDNALGAFAVHATITNDTDIDTLAGTAILVSGADASADVTGNDMSIHGNAVGIDVTGGSASITDNHIYDNGIGIRVSNGGTITALNDVNFAGSADNGTDVQLLAGAGAVTFGNNLKFAGNNFFIDNQDDQNIDLSGLTGTTFDVANDFRVEDHMHHKMDSDLPFAATGRIEWVDDNVYVTNPTIANQDASASTDSSIQRGVDAASANWTINVEAGTYAEDLLISQAGQKVVGAGDGAGGTTIDYTGKAGHNNGGVYISADDVELRDLHVTRTPSAALPSYGVKVDFVDGVTIDGVTIDNSRRTGLDLHGVTNVIVNDVTSQDNGGAGIFMTDVKGADLSNITTLNNPWTGVSVATSGQYVTIGTSDIVFSGTNSFGESGSDNGGLQLEMFNFATNMPYPITWSSNPSDNADVTIQSADFGYALSGESFNGGANDTRYVRFYQTLGQAQNAAAGSPDHIDAHDRYIQEADDSDGLPNSGPTDFYVFDNAGNTMSIQAAINAANSAIVVDTVHVDSGTYDESPQVNKSIILSGAGKATTHIDLLPAGTVGAPYLGALTISGAGTNATVEGFDIVGNDAVGTGLANSNILLGPGLGTIHILNNRIATGEIGGGSNGDDGMGLITSYTTTPSQFVASVDVQGNDFVPTGASSFRAFYVNPGVISFNFHNNTISGNYTGRSITQANASTITENAISGVGVAGSRSAGIGVWGYPDAATYGSALIQNNDFSNLGNAVSVLSANNVSILNNNFDNNDTGVLFADANPVANVDYTTDVVHDNSFANTTTTGINNTTSTTINAEVNWWGSADGPNSPDNTFHPNNPAGSAVLGPVDFVPWRTNGIDTMPAMRGFQPNAAVDTTPPATSTIDLDTASDSGSSTTDNITNDDTPTFNGTTEAGAHIQVLEGTTVLAETDADGSGAWSVTLSSALSNGTHMVVARASDMSGNSTDSSPLSVNIDTQAPLLMVPADSSVSEGTPVTLIGSANDTNSGVFSTGWAAFTASNGQSIPAAAGNTQSFTPNDNGTYVAHYSATDVAGNTTISGPVTVTVTNVAPTIAVDSVTSSINENSVATITATITDPGTVETFSVTIDWMDPNSTGATTISGLSSSASQTSVTVGNTTYSWNHTTRQITLEHTYTDDGASPGNGTASDLSAVTIDVSDGDDTGSIAAGSANITVNNLAPSSLAVTPSMSNVNNEGNSLSFTASAVDNPNDVLTYGWSITGPGLGSPITGSGTAINFTALDDGTYTIALTVSDDDGGSNTLNYNVAVADVAPTVNITHLDTPIGENTSTTLTFNLVDPGLGDLASTVQVSINFGDLTTPIVINSNPDLATLKSGGSVTLTHTYVDDNPPVTSSDPYSITFSSTQSPGGTYSNMGLASGSLGRAVTVDNVAPTGLFLTSTPTVPAGSPVSVNWVLQDDQSPDDVPGLRYTYFIDANNNGQFDGGEQIAPTTTYGDGTYGGSTVSSSATIPGSYFSSAGVYHVGSQIRDDDGGVTTQVVDVTVTPVTFKVVSLTPTPSGFIVTFNRAADTAPVNLYAGELAAGGVSTDSTDVIVVGTGGVGAVKGSLIWSADRTSFEFVKTGGILAPATYSVTLESGDTAFQDQLTGEDLDGDNNNVAGGNYPASFVVSSPGGARIVSMPDFARGATDTNGQTVNLPYDTSAAGIPVTISEGSNVTAVDFDVVYDPSLLNISSVLAGADNGGWSVTLNHLAPNRVRVTMFSGAGLSGGAKEIARLISNVPANAPYGGSEALRIENLAVYLNGSATSSPSIADIAVHKAVFIGDTNAAGNYTPQDATWISEVRVGTYSGFGEYPLTDPVIIADVNQNGVIDGNDSSWVTQKSLAPAARPEIPNIPPASMSWMPTQSAVDPTFAIPLNILGAPSTVVNVPLNITDSAVGTTGFAVYVNYDATKLHLPSGFDAGGITIDPTFDADGWNITTFVDESSPDRKLAIGFTRESGASSFGAGQIATISFAVSAGLTDGSTIPLDVRSFDGSDPYVDPPFSYSYVDGSIVIDAVAPQVAAVLANGTTWSSDFRDYVDGALGDSQARGYRMPGGAGQLATLPWTNVNELKVVFTEDVGGSLSASDFALVAAPGFTGFSPAGTSIPTIIGMSYNSSTFTATLSLSHALETSAFDIVIDDAGVADPAGNKLDGEWVNGTTVGNSGNGTAGGDFSFRVLSLPGDALDDYGTSSQRVVLSNDTQEVRNALNGFVVSSGAFLGYSARADLDGNGLVASADVIAVRTRQNSFLAGPPIAVVNAVANESPALVGGLAGLNVAGLAPAETKSAAPAARDEKIVDEAFRENGTSSDFGYANVPNSDMVSGTDTSLDAVDELFASLDEELALAL